jgi:uncharacterized membrane protein YheB (UPF0754 family)
MFSLPYWSRFLISPLVGGFVGFITNWIAITLLFRPKKKILGIQGLLQKRKSLIAQKAAEIIREYLLNTNEIKKVVDKKKVEDSIKKLVDRTLKYFPGFGKKLLSKVLRDMTYFYFFDKSGYIKDEMLELALSDADLENIVTEKIMNYDISELEKIIKQASGPEINFILISGLVLGVIIGLLQALLPW